MKITFFGTGYVGLVSGTCMAEIGHEVTCFDIDRKKIEEINKGKMPIYELGLEELVKKNVKEKRLNFTSSIDDAIKSSNTYFIGVGTPSKKDGSANLDYVKACAKDIGKNANKDDFLVVVKSTVPAGTNHMVYDVVKEELKKRKLNYDFNVCSNPEFLREGRAINDFMNPDRIVVGYDDPKVEKKVDEMYDYFLKNDVKIVKTNILSSEMSKYAANAILASRISFMNEISRLCDVVGANVESVKEAIGSDYRIGDSFLNAGIGYGGSCFPKDVKELISFTKSQGLEPFLIENIERTNKKQKEYFSNRVIEICEKHNVKKIGLLGLSFKPGTDDMREAPSLILIDRLLKEGLDVKAFDPAATERAKEIIGNRIGYADNIDEAVADVDIIIIVTEWSDFHDIKNKKLNVKAIIDGRNMFSLEEAKQFNIPYYSVGRPTIIG